MPQLVAPLEPIVPPGARGIWQRFLTVSLMASYNVMRRRRGDHQSRRLCELAGRALGRGGRVEFRLHNGGVISIRADDVYWIQHALFDRSYEPGVDTLFGRVLRPGDAFVDCGANLGLWSIAASRVIADRECVVAVESSTTTFEQLSANWRANGERFTLLHRAVADRDDEVVRFFSSASDPASSSMIEELAPADAMAETVRTVALGSLLSTRRDPEAADRMIVLKLDVEGLEARLLGTLNRPIDDDVLVVYEDHGRDTTHATTTSALASGFRVALLRDGGVLHPVDAGSIDRLDALKSNPQWGYNFIAFAPSGVAAERMRQAYPNLTFG